MVSPIFTLIIPFAAAFLLPLFEKAGRKVSITIFTTAILSMTLLSASWVYQMILGTAPVEIMTAGFQAPLSITLRMGMEEALVSTAVNIVAFTGLFVMMRNWKSPGLQGMMLYLMMITGVNGLILTRDIFNLFVFLEITSIASISLVALNGERKSLAAGFKYLIAGGIASAFFLIGTIYLYRLTGTLNIDGMVASKSLLQSQAGFIAVFLLTVAILIELKPFPANGWALDVYEAAPAGLSALLSAASSSAIFFAFYKIMPLFSASLSTVVLGVSMFSFFFSNLMGLKQKNERRMLGYSSVAQVSLVVASLLFAHKYGITGIRFAVITGGLLLNHIFSKSALFWLSEKMNGKGKSPFSVFLLGSSVVALAGLPPFPGFWAKWELVNTMIVNEEILWIVLLLAGALFEVIYLIRWFSFKVKEEDVINKERGSVIPVLFNVLILGLLGAYSAYLLDAVSFISALPLLAGVLLLLLDWIPVKLKGFIAIFITIGFGWFLYPELSGLSLIFGFLFIFGGVLHLFASMYKKGRRSGYIPLITILILSLMSLLKSDTSLLFFYNWEVITVSSWLLILRGKDAVKASTLYGGFSIGGAFLIMAGLIILDTLTAGVYSQFATVVIGLGFLVKVGALGVHIWLPSAYGESDDDFTSFLSSVLSKAGVYSLFVFAIVIMPGIPGSTAQILGWIGVITAVGGALMAVYQEDIKYLLAYSSISQLGYIILAFAMMNYSGWTTALYLTVNHFFFKGMLFLAVAGIILRTGTRYMYQMGGLIKKMPLSFISVLMAIIAVSGVPPLSGFGGKWLLYTSLIEKGWYLQAGFAFFASSVAFLYLFRLIFAMFLGQPKPEHKNLKEAPLWLIIPQYILIVLLMVVSTFPDLMIKPLEAAVSPYFPATLSWEGSSLISSLGYWNGSAVMYVTMGVFGTFLAWLLIVMRKPQPIKQLNIVYAAERPEAPHTTHFAHNFYAHYEKALGFLTRPNITKFWNGVFEATGSVASMFRNIYSGNGQTYALHLIMFVTVLYLISGVVS